MKTWRTLNIYSNSLCNVSFTTFYQTYTYIIYILHVHILHVYANWQYTATQLNVSFSIFHSRINEIPCLNLIMFWQLHQFLFIAKPSSHHTSGFWHTYILIEKSIEENSQRKGYYRHTIQIYIGRSRYILLLSNIYIFYDCFFFTFSYLHLLHHIYVYLYTYYLMFYNNCILSM